MPDDKKHSSKQKNEHSYKLLKTDGSFKIKFIGKRADQGTVVARLKYDSRDIKEWKVEKEPRVCALELAKSVHWIVDIGTPPHTVADWDDELHSKIEKHFDKNWKKLYDKKKTIFGRDRQIKDIYRWAKKFIEDKYQRNYELLQIYRAGGSITNSKGNKLGREVILDIAQNLADYFAYIDRMINYDKMLQSLP